MDRRLTKELFHQKELNKKVAQYTINASEITKAKEIFVRWNTSVDLTKEKENQQSFLKEFFEEILGYQAIAGKKDNTLWWESGSQVDGKKPDGILGLNLVSYKAETVSMKDAGDVRVVIELKDCTVSLDKNQKRTEFWGTPVEQGFSYASKVGSSCEFVIISNFKQIRLYKYGQGGGEGKYHEFLLANLAENDDKIREFCFLLSKDRLFTKTKNHSPAHSLDATEKGEEIERKFYAHYSTLREEIWHNLVALNSEKTYGKNFYLYKAQKLIDRIIFIRFCRENGALDNDAVLEALNNKFVPGKYNRLKLLFQAMDCGNPEIGIARFNGGLFATDADLDNLQVSDDIIDKIIILYAHDFGSDLDVNILGHIFEQSISDLENLTNSTEKKRKKDGVFYTPAYITEYIVREAVGGWLADRKVEIKAKEGSKDWWQQYAEKLKSIKVLDPACGSGAFLVKVFDYLQNEWKEVQKNLQTWHIKTDWNYQDILTHNIYGVDINPASTGITKLSLWLKTAHYREPLTTLDGNIKIGNSLIDDENIAGYYSEFEGKVIQEVIAKDLFNASEIEKLTAEGVKKSLAFKWDEEFPFKFDVVVGNPPYGTWLEEEHKKWFDANYKIQDYQKDLYLLFLERYRLLLQDKGFLGVIISNTWLQSIQFNKIRSYLMNEYFWKKVLLLNEKTFEATVDTHCIIFKKEKQKNTNFQVDIRTDNSIKQSHIIPQDETQIDETTISFGVTPEKLELYKKIKNNSKQLKDFCDVFNGVKPFETGKGNPPQTKEIMQTQPYVVEGNKPAPEWRPLLRGGQIDKYLITWNNDYWVLYGKHLAAPRDPAIFEAKDKLMFRQTGDSIIATYINTDFVARKNMHICLPKEGSDALFILALVNSNLMDFYYSILNPEKGEALAEVKKFHVEILPIPQITIADQQPFIEKAQAMLNLTKELNEFSSAFLEYLKAKMGNPAKLSTKLQKWYNLKDDEFLTEINKLSKTQKLTSFDERAIFTAFKDDGKKAKEIQSTLTRTDAEIDAKVYELYGLSNEEIKIVEQQ